MKNTLTFIFSILLLLGGIQEANAQTYFYMNSITVSPANPTSNDVVSITISGDKSDPCSFPQDFSVSTAGTNISLFMAWNNYSNIPPYPFCSFVITPWDTTIVLGTMAAGSYTIIPTGNAFGNSVPGNQLNFSVSGAASAPNADFSGTPLEGCGDLTVVFTNLSTDADNFGWNFGDGNTSTDENPTHTYTSPGVYDVSLLVFNTVTMENDAENKNGYVSVYALPEPNLGADTSIYENQSLILSPGNFSSYSWSNGASQAGIIFPGSTGAGVYTITCTVINADGCEATDEIIITILEGTDGVSNVNHDVLKVFPNPTSGLFSFTVDKQEPFQLEIFDIDGKKVMNAQSFTPQDIHQVDAEYLPKGIYTIRLMFKDEIATQKLFIK